MDDYDALIEALTAEKSRIAATHPVWSYYTPRRTWNQPAYEYLNPKTGKRHRIFGPAFINPEYNVEEWYKEGILHRIGGPAVTHNFNFYWYKDGKHHRLDGPAVDALGQPKEYWIDGVKYSPKEYKKEIARRTRKGLIK